MPKGPRPDARVDREAGEPRAGRSERRNHVSRASVLHSTMSATLKLLDQLIDEVQNVRKLPREPFSPGCARELILAKATPHTLASTSA